MFFWVDGRVWMRWNCKWDIGRYEMDAAKLKENQRLFRHMKSFGAVFPDMCSSKGEHNSWWGIVALGCKWVFCVFVSHAKPLHPLHWCVASRIKDAPELVDNYWLHLSIHLHCSIALSTGYGLRWGRAPPSVPVSQWFSLWVKKANVWKGEGLQAPFTA